MDGQHLVVPGLSFVAAHWQQLTVLAIILLTLYLFVREAVPAPLTALLAATLLMVTGVLTPAEGLSGFSSEATITVMAVFVLSAGVERTGALTRAIGALLSWAKDRPRRQTLALGGVAGPVSGFINNTAVVAVMLPAAMRMARESGRSPSQILMPLSFLSMLGGTLTVIGTSTNLLGNNTLGRLGHEPFPFFGFFFIGLTAFLVGVLYFLVLGRRLLPDRGGDQEKEAFDLKGFLSEFRVPAPEDGEDEGPVGKSLRELGLTRGAGIQVLRVFRPPHVHAAPRGTFRLMPGDRLTIQGSRETLERLPKKTGLAHVAEEPDGVGAERPPEPAREEKAARDERAKDEAQGEGLATAELVLTPGSRLIGKMLSNLDLRTQHDVIVLAVRHHGRMAIGPLARTRLAMGDVLLVQGSRDALDDLEQASDFVLTRERGQRTRRTERIPVALAIILGVVLLASFEVLPIVVAALAGGVAMVLSGCIRLGESLQAIRWDVILLLAGIIPLGLAFEKVGLANLVALGLVDLGGHMPGLVFLILLFVVTSVVTEIVSNNASVVLLVPVAVVAAVGVGLDPRPFALTVMLAASTSMLTPIGYQTNTMIYAPGRYRFSDFLRVGGPLNLILAFVIPFMVTRFYPL